ncbi:MAG: hypothetical protein QXI39_06715 [Candidatus Bathyarchaeia archaeon]
MVGLFERCKRGRHHLDRALRNLLNYYATVEGYQDAQIERLRKAIPRIKTGVDYRVAETLRKIKEEAPMKYRVLYTVILDSRVRLAHAIYLLNRFEGERLEDAGSFSMWKSFL